jgi:hypothetical protein
MTGSSLELVLIVLKRGRTPKRLREQLDDYADLVEKYQPAQPCCDRTTQNVRAAIGRAAETAIARFGSPVSPGRSLLPELGAVVMIDSELMIDSEPPTSR